VNKEPSKKEFNLNIFFTYNLVMVIAALVFYPLFPLLLNYPPSSINTRFNIEFSHIPYYIQYIIINLLIITINYIYIKALFKGVDKWKVITQSLDTNDINHIKEIRKRSFLMPHVVFILQLTVPLILVGLLFIILGFRNSADVKFFMILGTLSTITAAISYLFSKKYFREVLKYTYINGSESRTVRLGLPAKIILQIIPLFLLSILFTIMLGQSGLVKEKGEALFKSYKRELLMQFKNVSYIQNEAQLKPVLDLIKTDNPDDITFYITPSGEYHTQDHSVLSNFFLKYTKELAFQYQGHTFDYYGSDVQGAVIKVRGEKGDWILGIKYAVVSSETNTLFIISFIALSLLALSILIYFSKTLSDDISLISASLTEIAEGEDIQLENKIAVTSNDEIGDLAIAFNKVQDRERQHIHDIKEQQRINMERERLVSLGQMLGGITHNLNSPIVLISDYIESMDEVARKMENLPAGDTISSKDYLEMIRELRNNLSEMRPHCFFISDLLTTVRNQAVQLNDSISQSFTIAELQARIRILMDYELKKHNCILKPEIQLEPYLIIKGEINNLVQVINNLILNAIQAYEDKGGVIELIIAKRDYNKIVFAVRDHAKGIPEEVQQKLFQEMVTTKGPESSGLGLYMSRLTIKGRFGGELIYNSTPGEGSTFYIIIPYDEAE
jgi:signal transduction histidine kinase